MSEDVDAARWQADLIDTSRICEVLLSDTVLLNRCAKNSESRENTICIAHVRPDENVDVTSGSRYAVGCEGMGADDYKINIAIDKCGEHVEEIIVHAR